MRACVRYWNTLETCKFSVYGEITTKSLIRRQNVLTFPNVTPKFNHQEIYTKAAIKLSSSIIIVINTLLQMSLTKEQFETTCFLHEWFHVLNRPVRINDSVWAGAQYVLQDSVSAQRRLR